MPYSYNRTITIDHTKVGASDSANFKLLVSGTYPWAATVANAGNIQNTTTVTLGARTITVPADLVFAQLSSGASLLTWEFEYYDQTTGVFIAWVLVPNVSHTADTVIYAVYGNAAITTYQGGGRGAAWAATDEAIYHTPDGSTLYIEDSTANAFDLTNMNGVTAVAGEILGAASFVSASSQYLTRSSAPVATAPMTLSAWTDLESVQSGEFPIVALDDVSGNSSYWLDSFLLTGQQYWRLIQRYSGGAYQQWYAVTPDGSEHYVVGTFTNSSTMAFYLDGALQSPSVTVGSPGSPATMAVTNIGGSTVAGYGTGYIEEARVRSVVISADTVLAEYNNQSSPSTFYTVGSASPIIVAAQTVMKGITYLSSDPSMSQDGAVWYNTTTHHLKVNINGTVTVIA